MAGYQSATSKELKILQKRLQYLEVTNVPVSPTRNIVGEGSSAMCVNEVPSKSYRFTSQA